MANRFILSGLMFFLFAGMMQAAMASPFGGLLRYKLPKPSVSAPLPPALTQDLPLHYRQSFRPNDVVARFMARKRVGEPFNIPNQVVVRHRHIETISTQFRIDNRAIQASQWHQAKKDMRHLALTLRMCDFGLCKQSSLKALSKILAGTRQLSDELKMSAIHRLVGTTIRYRSEGSRDVWQAPLKTMARGEGDCEDHALMAGAFLMHSGVPADRLFLFLMQNKHSGKGHAVLAVLGENGKRYIFDNQQIMVTDAPHSDYAIQAIGAKGGLFIPQKQLDKEPLLEASL
ncbi:MAG: transglutaminase-like cysteine peptidase [Cohaesibacter sp.]|jgi:predicted transglutaminase-like cysteine proteinase|nr:transglutaminase-like cysteine peptidase [Cohaesibacter sp.]